MSKKLPGGDLQDARRASALLRLQNQLKSGTKTQKKTGDTVPLTEKDKLRINSEITRLTQLVAS